MLIEGDKMRKVLDVFKPPKRPLIHKVQCPMAQCPNCGGRKCLTKVGQNYVRCDDCKQGYVVIRKGKEKRLIKTGLDFNWY